jgi:hypothetical protein
MLLLVELDSYYLLSLYFEPFNIIVIVDIAVIEDKHFDKDYQC